MTAVREVPVAERRARLGLRHRLAERASSVGEVAGALVALHATDPATVYLSAAARLNTPSVPAIEDALYADRTLMRMLGMRRTMFVVPDDVAPLVQAGCTAAVAVQQRKLAVDLLATASIGDEAWLDELLDAVHRLLLDKGPATATALAKLEPRLQEKVVLSPGKPYESRANITSRVLLLLAAEGRIVRGRPQGSWISSQYKWSAIEEWLPAGMPSLEAAEARSALARRWLRAFGPGSAEDLKWWTGWTMGDTRKALAAVQAVEVALPSGPGWLLPDDVEPVAEPAPWAALLPALDPTPMGWIQRDWYLGGHAPELFDRTGNIGPSVWWNGRVIGGWAQRPDGEIALRLLEDPGADAVAMIETERVRLRSWLADTRITPRFRTPLERELATP